MMNADWKDFLSAKGAQWNDAGEVTTFGLPEIERYMVKNGPVFTSLAHQAIIKVSGEEAFDFLQGQFTNDLSDVTDEHAQLSAYCDPQGKVLAVLMVFKHQDAFYLNFDGSLKDTILKRLTMFKLRSKVELEDVSDEMIHIGYGGDFGDLDIQRLLTTKIKELYEVKTLDMDGVRDVIAVKRPGPYHCYSFFGPLASMKTVWEQLKSNGEATNNIDWKLLQIVSGQPSVDAVTGNEFIAQFLNLDKLDAINFKKGCFPGQEVIARMHYRGKATKRMLRLHLGDADAPAPGQEFVLTDDADKKYKFTCILSAPDVFEGSVCLAVTTLKPLEAVNGHLKSESGAPANVEPLPYDLTEE
ncbi:CAF17-like 4Fe-4S cluster assembly/insertion protein YgfZ [Hydrogenovibrio thermophilus]|jgi:folate-binding protein YgfZ|uniref:Folate-binding protein n=1 Tax=Hydrogenovibrio thermophilus TaxID=265883 RepID=A0A410H1Y9_9GAMM|nr:folate-binding protein YgfZ [Hydrogenovibrio thermophilus]QAB14914.1 folate-binding protein [Hydrogenovibrio thermophilus]